MAVTERIFSNRINTNILKHTTSGTNTVWSGIDHIVLDLIALDDGLSDVQLDTSTVGQEDTVDFTVNGFLTFILGDKSVPEGSYLVQLTAIDSSDNKTQLIHPDGEYIIFSFFSTKTVT